MYNADGTTLTVDDTEYELTPGLAALIWNERPRATQYNDRQIKVKSFPNQAGCYASRPEDAWKWENVLKKIVVPEESVAEEYVDTGDTGSVESDTATVGNVGESLESSPDIASPASTHRPLSSSVLPPLSPPSPLHIRAFGKAKKTKERKHPYESLFQEI